MDDGARPCVPFNNAGGENRLAVDNDVLDAAGVNGRVIECGGGTERHVVEDRNVGVVPLPQGPPAFEMHDLGRPGSGFANRLFQGEQWLLLGEKGDEARKAIIEDVRRPAERPQDGIGSRH